MLVAVAVLVVGVKAQRVRLTLSDGRDCFFGMVAHEALDVVGGIGCLQVNGFYRIPLCRPNLRAGTVVVNKAPKDPTRPASYLWFYTDVVEVLSLEVRACEERKTRVGARSERRTLL